MRLTISEKIRQADAMAIQSGIPSVTLMDNAARHLVLAACELLKPDESVCIFCGSGNNGGDGVAAAVQLIDMGISVCTYLIGRRDKMTADTREMERRLLLRGGTLIDYTEASPLPDNCGLIIDAMFGIGLNSPLRGAGLCAAKQINHAGIPVISADVPSGISADTGAILGEAVHASITVTFSIAKPGLYLEPGCAFCGEVRICDIGIPEEYLRQAEISTTLLQLSEEHLPTRDPLTHKYNYGRLVVLGGSVGYTGAISLCSRAAIRCGAGVVFTGVPEKIYEITAIKNDEAVVFPLACSSVGQIAPEALPDIFSRLKTASAVVFGPGLGRSDDLVDITETIIRSAVSPLVLDADALWAVGQKPEILLNAHAPLVLTPHEGEFKALGGILTPDRLASARAFSQKNNCTLLLKGHHSLAAFPDGRAVICPYGNPGMARGGSGDVLAGILGAMLCQLPLYDAVSAGMLLHACTGDLCAEQFGEYSMTPSDMINCIYQITKQLSAR